MTLKVNTDVRKHEPFIAIIYGSTTGNTKMAAEEIHWQLGHPARLEAVCNIEPSDLMSHDIWLLGVSTWNIGDMQDDWAEVLPRFEGLDLSGKTIGLFATGAGLASTKTTSPSFTTSESRGGSRRFGRRVTSRRAPVSRARRFRRARRRRRVANHDAHYLARSTHPMTRPPPNKQRHRMHHTREPCVLMIGREHASLRGVAEELEHNGRIVRTATTPTEVRKAMAGGIDLVTVEASVPDQRAGRPNKTGGGH